MKDENPELRVIVKEIPILGPTSIDATKAAYASIAQGKYYEMHSALYAAKGKFGGGKILKIAQSVGLNVDRLKTDMESSKVKDMYESNIQLGEAIGIRGTPGMVVGEEIILGAIGEKKLTRLIQGSSG